MSMVGIRRRCAIICVILGAVIWGAPAGAVTVFPFSGSLDDLLAGAAEGERTEVVCRTDETSGLGGFIAVNFIDVETGEIVSIGVTTQECDPGEVIVEELEGADAIAAAVAFNFDSVFPEFENGDVFGEFLIPRLDVAASGVDADCVRCRKRLAGLREDLAEARRRLQAARERLARFDPGDPEFQARIDALSQRENFERLTARVNADLGRAARALGAFRTAHADTLAVEIRRADGTVGTPRAEDFLAEAESGAKAAEERLRKADKAVLDKLIEASKDGVQAALSIGSAVATEGATGATAVKDTIQFAITTFEVAAAAFELVAADENLDVRDRNLVLTRKLAELTAAKDRVFAARDAARDKAEEIVRGEITAEIAQFEEGIPELQSEIEAQRARCAKHCPVESAARGDDVVGMAQNARRLKSEDGRLQVFLSTDITFVDNDGFAGMDGERRRIAGGFGYRLSDLAVVGLAARYIDTDLDEGGILPSSLEADSWGVAAFAQTRPAGFLVDMAASYGDADLDVAAGGATASLGARSYAAQMRVARPLSMGGLTLTPFASASWVRGEIGAFTASDGGSVPSANETRVFLGGGAALGGAIDMGDGLTLTPSGRVSALTNTDDGDVNVFAGIGLGVMTDGGVSGGLDLGYSKVEGGARGLSVGLRVTAPLR